jgi:hypothetical protein
MTFTPTSTPITAVVTYPYGLNLRAEPGTTAEVLDVLPENMIVVILDQQIEADGILWQLIEADGQTGWVSVEFLSQS